MPVQDLVESIAAEMEDAEQLLFIRCWHENGMIFPFICFLLQACFPLHLGCCSCHSSFTFSLPLPSTHRHSLQLQYIGLNIFTIAIYFWTSARASDAHGVKLLATEMVVLRKSNHMGQIKSLHGPYLFDTINQSISQSINQQYLHNSSLAHLSLFIFNPGNRKSRGRSSWHPISGTRECWVNPHRTYYEVSVCSS